MNFRRISNNFGRIGIRYMVGIIVMVSSIVVFTGLSTSASEKEVPGNLYKYYTQVSVEAGDSLWSIAEKFCDSRYVSTLDYIDEVKRMNNISDDNIYAGTKLTVYYYSGEYKE